MTSCTIRHARISWYTWQGPSIDWWTLPCANHWTIFLVLNSSLPNMCARCTDLAWASISEKTSEMISNREFQQPHLGLLGSHPLAKLQRVMHELVEGISRLICLLPWWHPYLLQDYSRLIRSRDQGTCPDCATIWQCHHGTGPVTHTYNAGQRHHNVSDSQSPSFGCRIWA